MHLSRIRLRAIKGFEKTVRAVGINEHVRLIEELVVVLVYFFARGKRVRRNFLECILVTETCKATGNCSAPRKQPRHIFDQLQTGLSRNKRRPLRTKACSVLSLV